MKNHLSKYNLLPNQSLVLSDCKPRCSACLLESMVDPRGTTFPDVLSFFVVRADWLLVILLNFLYLN